MFNILGRIFGSSDIISKGMDLIDDAFETDIEKLEADTKSQVTLITARTSAKTELINAYSGYKIAQRYLMLLFTIPFIVLVCIGIGAALLGAPLDNVKQAIAFANEMWLGEIVLLIVGFYFGGGVLESGGRAFGSKSK